MKVLLINGSPHEKGCTYTALDEIRNQLTRRGIDSEILWLGKEPIMSCQGCGACTVACMSGAMDLRGFLTRQIMAEVDAICK